MLACIFMSMGPAKHEQVAIFLRKMRGLRMFSAILRAQSRRNQHQAHLSATHVIPGVKGHQDDKRTTV